ncbi:MAG: ASKHA domain-containing protein [Oscillospiraceae bacterium]|nr:ASKHA domain-containing protein [Oscillospiraceae bacterium]
MYTIKFCFESGDPVIIDANPGEKLLDVARKANVAIDAPCSGNGVCGKCRVRLASGSLDAPINRHITSEEYKAGWRLACLATITGNAEIEVPDIASAYRSRMKMADLSSPEEIAIFENLKAQLAGAGITFGSDLSFLPLELTEPTLDDTMPDNERLIRAVEAATGVDESAIMLPYSVLKDLAWVLRESEFQVKCVISRDQDRILIRDVLPQSNTDPIVGFALDLGTTSLAGVLVDLETGKILAKASGGNGQIRYGADVINRIIESDKVGGRKRLRDAVVKESIIPMLASMYRSAGINPRRIYRMVLAGNTTMNHLLLGLHADPIRMEPFVPSFFRTDYLYVRDIGLKMNPLAELIVAPNIGSYVGGDITAGALVSMIWNNPEMSLFIDLGTNGELVFGNSEFQMSCACSAGPAFEGGDISCGMRATDGAIEACSIDKETMEPTLTVVGNTAPAGICGSGIIDIIAELFRCGIINGKGKFVREGERILHDEHDMGSYVLAWQKDTGGVKDVVINEVDIDNFIRAKGAIFSATQTMLGSLGFDASVIERVYVAGGIGSGINMRNAVTIGMFPDIPLEHFHYIGNSSQAGAYAMLLSSQAREKVFELGRSMTYLELSNEPGYMDEFVAACFLPHTDASLFPSVEV